MGSPSQPVEPEPSRMKGGDRNRSAEQTDNVVTTRCHDGL